MKQKFGFIKRVHESSEVDMRSHSELHVTMGVRFLQMQTSQDWQVFDSN